MYIGVIYRPPNGYRKGALHKIDVLKKRLPKNNVANTGDFNIDLLSLNSGFEQIFYANDFIPLISIPAHEKPECRGTLIDNIFLNSTSNFLTSRVLQSRVHTHTRSLA